MIPISYNVRSIAVRRTSTAAAVLGIALVVFVLAASLMLGAGIEKTMLSTGSTDRAIVIRKGSDAEMASGIDGPTVALLGVAPGVRQVNGTPLMVGEVVVVAAMTKKGMENSLSNVMVRGVPDSVYEFRKGVRFVEGRPPKPGTDEAAVGRAIMGRFEGLELGKTIELKKNRPITIVGVFTDGGSSFESEIWTDLDFVRQAFGRGSGVSSVRVQLASASDFGAFETNVESDKRLGLEAMRETDYYAKQGEDTSQFILGLGYMISFFFAVGAMIGATITMYASVASRTREIGTLRALGFPRWQILFSFLLESTLVALVGGVLGMLAAMALGAVKFSMMNFQSWSEIVFTFTPTPATLLSALVFACLMGLIGGFLPAIRAARMSPVRAMRD